MRKAFVVSLLVVMIMGVSGQAQATTRNSCPRYERLAVRVGWKPEEIPQLSQIMYRESRCQNGAVGENRRSDGSVWSRDLGLMQINDYSWRKWLRLQGVITVDSDLFTPEVNLKAALLIWKYGEDRHGNGWIAWKATSGK